MLQEYNIWIANNKARIDSLSQHKKVKNMYPVYQMHYRNYLENEANKLLGE